MKMIDVRIKTVGWRIEPRLIFPRIFPYKVCMLHFVFLVGKGTECENWLWIGTTLLLATVKDARKNIRRNSGDFAAETAALQNLADQKPALRNRVVKRGDSADLHTFDIDALWH